MNSVERRHRAYLNRAAESMAKKRAHLDLRTFRVHIQSFSDPGETLCGEPLGQPLGARGPDDPCDCPQCRERAYDLAPVVLAACAQALFLEAIAVEYGDTMDGALAEKERTLRVASERGSAQSVEAPLRLL